MVAAAWGADEAVEELLRWGADPNAMDANLNTALSLSLLSKSPTIVARLAPITTTGLESLLKTLAMEQVEMTRPLYEFIERASKHEEATVKETVEFGHTDLTKFLSHKMEANELFKQELLQEQSVTVPNILNDTDTFFRYQLFSIPIPLLFSVPNISDTGSETFFRYRFRYNQKNEKFPVPGIPGTGTSHSGE